MSKQLMFSVYDSKVEAYMQPWYARAIGEAMRSFEEACNDPKTMMCKHPEDYTLFKIGEFDEKTGVITPDKTHQALGLAVQFKKTSNNNLHAVQQNH